MSYHYWNFNPEDHSVSGTNDFEKWALQDGRPPYWTVARTPIGEWEVSTVFLGINHNFFDGAPLLFETMIFGSDLEYQTRGSTYREALAMHQEGIEFAKKEQGIE